MRRITALCLAALLSGGCYLTHGGSTEPIDAGGRVDAGPLTDAGRPRRDSGIDPGRRDTGPDAGPDAGADAGAADAGPGDLCDEPGAVTPDEECARGCSAEERCDAAGVCCRFCLCAPTVRLDPGEYWRGSPLTEAGRESDEVRHRVRLTRAFEIDRTEVTQEAWQRLMNSEPSGRRDCPRCPVEQVNRFEAMLFANARSDVDGLERCYPIDTNSCAPQIGAGCPSGPGWNRCNGPSCFGAAPASPDCVGWRLPTEAEWEYAARAGSDTAFVAGNDQELANVHGWCASAAGMSHPVGLKAANPFGLLDIIGNVYEWTEDAYAPYETEPQPRIDPLQTRGQGGVIRGGSFAFGDSFCRSANRGAREIVSRENILGFRLVRTVP